MILANEVADAAARIVGGDASAVAAAELERALYDHHADEDELEELTEALALYAPGLGAPYLNHQQLCDVIRQSGLSG